MINNIRPSSHVEHGYVSGRAQGYEKMGELGVVTEYTDTTTINGSGKLFWINIHATAASVVTISDDSTEKLSIGVAANTTEFQSYIPAITLKTSLVITKSSGTCKITVCHNVS